MSITFITKREHDVDASRITIISSLEPLLDWLSTTPEIGFDKEFTDLNVLNALPLLSQFGNVNNQFVVDDISFPSLSYLEPFKDKLFIGHNIKIDISLARLQGVDIRNIYDTMTVEQRLGLDSKRPNTLGETYFRKCKKRMDFKKVNGGGKAFQDMNKSDRFRTEHVLYSADDVRVLPEIKEAQKFFIAKFNHFFLTDIERKVTPILADAELEGITAYKDKFETIIKENKSKLIEVERELDAELDKLDLRKLKKERVQEEVEQFNLFGFENKVVKIPQKSFINYNSGDQVLPLFTKAGLPTPLYLDKAKDKASGTITYEEKPSIREEALQKFQIENPGNKLSNFIELLLKQKEFATELNTFGEKFIKSRILKTSGNYEIGYLNDKTGKVHTQYKQVETTTGRLSSGGAKIGYFNSQNIPAIPKYREAFGLSQQEIADGWYLTTCDLTGAEVVIMCAFAKDKRLYKWAVEEDDLHSPMATLCWQAIARERIRRNKSLEYKDTRGGIHQLTPDIIVDKHNNKQMRVDFKPETFGVVYGANDKTAAGAVNIPVHEGKIIVDIIKENIPDTFAMVEQATKDALENGYLKFNNRTNSGKWFKAVLDGKPSREQITKISGEARNARIQGTQADMVKEAMYEIWFNFKQLGVQNCMLLQIHDELVWKHRSFNDENAAIHSKMISDTMADVGTKYLEGFTIMKAEAQVLTHWTK